MIELLDNINMIHTTPMGIDRIKRNLKIDVEDIVVFIKEKLLNKECKMCRKGKNYYASIDNITITINSYSYTIITAHINK